MNTPIKTTIGTQQSCENPGDYIQNFVLYHNGDIINNANNQNNKRKNKMKKDTIIL